MLIKGILERDALPGVRELRFSRRKELRRTVGIKAAINLKEVQSFLVKF